MKSPLTGTVTFLFTDLEGQTRLWEEQPEEMRAALARHDAILRRAVVAHDGQVVKTTGDGLHAAFTRAPDAISAALEQRITSATTPIVHLSALFAFMERVRKVQSPGSIALH